MSAFQDFMSAVRSGNIERAQQLYSTMVPASGSETLAMNSRQDELLADRSPGKWREDAASTTRRAGANRTGASLITGDNALGIGAVDIAAPTAVPAALADFRETREGVRRGEVGPGEYGAMAAAIPLSFLGLGAAAKGAAKTAGKSVDNMTASMRRLFSRAAPEEGAVGKAIEAEQSGRRIMDQGVPDAVRMPDELSVGQKLAITNREIEAPTKYEVTGPFGTVYHTASTREGAQRYLDNSLQLDKRLGAPRINESPYTPDIKPERALQYSREQPAMYHGVRDGTNPVGPEFDIGVLADYLKSTPENEINAAELAEAMFGIATENTRAVASSVLTNHLSELHTIKALSKANMEALSSQIATLKEATGFEDKSAELGKLFVNLPLSSESSSEQLIEGLENLRLSSMGRPASRIATSEFDTIMANAGIGVITEGATGGRVSPAIRQQVENIYDLGREIREIDDQIVELEIISRTELRNKISPILKEITSHGLTPIKSIQREGFRRGRSAEANMAGTSLSPDPTVSMRTGFAGHDVQNMLAVNTGDISVDNVRPQDYLTRNYGQYSREAINKPNAFSEDETFFRADTGGQGRLAARELSPEEARYVERSDRAVDDAMRSASNLKASGVIRPGNHAQAQRTYSSFRNLIQDIAALKQFGRGGAEKATRELLGRVETIAAIDGDPRMAKVAEDFISKLGPSQQTAFREFWSDLQTAATMNRQARTLSDIIKDRKYDQIISGERKFGAPTLEDLGVRLTPELQEDVTDFMANRGKVGNNMPGRALQQAIKDGYDRFFTQATHARRKLLQHSDKLALMLTAAGAATAGGNTAEAAPSLAEMDAAAVLPNGPILDEFKGIQDMINAARDEDKINDPATLRAIRARHRELLSKLIDDAVEE